MTTPSPPEFDAGGGRLLGTSGLQQSIDKFDSAVGKLSGVAASMAASMGNGMTRSPAMSANAEGATFSAGQFPPMGAWANQAVTGGSTWGTAPLPGGTGEPPGLVTPPRRRTRGTLGDTASGSGANGGGASLALPATFAQTATQAQGNFGGASGSGGQPGGGQRAIGNNPMYVQGTVLSSSYGNGSATGSDASQNYTFSGTRAASSASPGGGSNEWYRAPAGPNMQNGDFYTGQGIIGSGGAGNGTGGSGSGFGGAAVQATFNAAGTAMTSGMGQLSNQLLYNAYGTQMQAQWGQSAQSAQNSAFGYYNQNVNNAAQGSPQQAIAEMNIINQMTGGGAIGQGPMRGATNALAFANQGMGAGSAASLASVLYNPVNAMRVQMLTGVSSINQKTGQDNPLSSIIGGLASAGDLGGGGYNAKTGTFNQQALTKSFATGRGKSYMNLQSLYHMSDSQIQDVQSMVGQANQIAVASNGKASFSAVMNEINQAQYGSNTKGALAQLQKWDPNFKQSSIQQQGNLASQGMAQQQGESGAYNRAVSDFTGVMGKATTAMSAFLDKTGLGKLVGAGTGSLAGLASSGIGGWISKAASIAEPFTAAMGGGAASVATTAQSGAGRTAGSSLSSVPAQARAAVADAEAQKGKPYVYGGASPQTSFDCSGLVMWAYGQAGVKLPRTSEQQWAALKNRSVPVKDAREGDIVFSAGSDGSASSPGHEALVASGSQVIEAPYTGANIRVRAFSPGEWQHAARPVGSVTGSSAGPASVSTGGGSRLAAGNTGAGAATGGDSALGLTSDADSTLFGGGGTSSLALASSGGGAAPAGGSAGTGAGTAAGGSQSFKGGGTAAQNQALAKEMAQSLYGWSGNQWTDGLLPLWNNESGFQTKARNAQSGAYGIPQSLPASKMASAGSDYMTNPVTQLKWGLSYVKSRYGTPVAAEAHEKAYNWYAAGTPSAAPGVALVGERGPELVRLSGGQQVMDAAQTSSILRGTGAKTAQAPWTSSAAAQLVLDTLSPANKAPRGGAPVSVSIGSITVSAPNMTGTQTASDTQVLAQLILAQVEDALSKNELIRNIASGETG